MPSHWLQHSLVTLTLSCAVGSCSYAFAQVPEQIQTPSVDEILRSGADFGNKAFIGLLGGDGGAVNMRTPEGNSVVEAASNISAGCASRLQRVLRAFGESKVARGLHGYGWGNVVSVDLWRPLAVLGGDVRATYRGSLAETHDTRMRTTFDAECKLGFVTYTATIPRYGSKNGALGDLKITSTVALDLRLLRPVGEELYGLARLSDICHEVADQSTTQHVCSPELLDVYCQFDTCYSESLVELVESGKIRSIHMTGPVYDRVIEAERDIQTKRESEQANKARQIKASVDRGTNNWLLKKMG